MDLSSGIAQDGKKWHGAFTSSVLTLCLGILGSAVLPVPFAYSRTGVLAGGVAAMVVALSNTVTSRLLIKVAARLNVYSYEKVAGTVGGRVWGLVALCALMALLWGTLSGEIALLADLGSKAVADLFGTAAPAWLLASHGRVVMTLLTVSVVLPLCTLRQIRQLEAAATGAMSCLAVMAAVIVTNAVRAGFPAVKSGELPLFEMRWTPQTPVAVSVFSYAFYVNPMLLPLLQELPRGRAGVDLLSNAVAVATVGVAFSVYAVIGICAAGTYGLDTPGDLMAVSLLQGWKNGALECMVALYLSVSIPALAITLRYTLASLLAGSSESGEVAPTTRRQDVLLAMLTLAPALGVALVFPGSGAEKIFSLTGATAGCLLCYCIPVACHLRLYFFGMRRYKRPAFAEAGVPLLVARSGQMLPWSDPLIDTWLAGKRRVGGPRDSRQDFTVQHSPFMDMPLAQPGPPAEVDSTQQQSRSAPAHSMGPTAQPGAMGGLDAAVPAVSAAVGDEEQPREPSEDSDMHFEPTLAFEGPPTIQRRRSAPLDTMISNGSMDMRRYATFLDSAGLTKWEQVGLFVDNVVVPLAVLLLGVVLSVMAVAQQMAG